MVPQMPRPRSAPYQLTTAGRSYPQKVPASTAERGIIHEDIRRASLLHERDHGNGATPQQVYASLWAARLIELAPPPPGAPANWILLRRTITGDLALDDAVDQTLESPTPDPFSRLGKRQLAILRCAPAHDSMVGIGDIALAQAAGVADLHRATVIRVLLRRGLLEATELGQGAWANLAACRRSIAGDQAVAGREPADLGCACRPPRCKSADCASAPPL